MAREGSPRDDHRTLGQMVDAYEAAERQEVARYRQRDIGDGKPADPVQVAEEIRARKLAAMRAAVDVLTGRHLPLGDLTFLPINLVKP